MRFPFCEHRLIHLRIEDIQKQRAAAGASNLLMNQTGGVSTRQAQSNASQQEQTHQDALAANQLRDKGIYVGNLDKAQYSTGETEPYKLPDGKTIYVPKGSTPTVPGGTPLPNGAPPPATQSSSPQVPMGGQAPGPTNVVYRPPRVLTGQDLINAANQRRNQRLRNMGVEPNSDVLAILQQGGTFTGDTQNGEAVFLLNGQRVTVSNISPDAAKSVSDAYTTDYAAQIADEQKTAADAFTQKTVQGQSDAATSHKEANTYTPTSQFDTSFIDAALAGLGPEYQIIGESLKAQMGAIFQQKVAAAQNYADEVAAVNETKSAYDSVISQMRTDAKTIYDASEKFATENENRRLETLTKQQENADAQLQFREQKLVRDERKKLDRQIDQMTAAQALGDGFGSSNWTKSVIEAEAEGEQAIIDLQKEFGFKRADVALGFTETINNVYEFYGQKKLDALSKHDEAIKTINEFSLAATEKQEERKSKAKADLRTSLANIAKDQAKEIKDATKDVQNVLNQLRDDKRANEQLGLNMLDKFIDNYGSNVPSSLVEMVKRYLPDIDVQQVISTKTLAQMKKGGSGITFPASLMQSSGQPPTFESFITDKENQLGKSLSLEAREKYRKEYYGLLAGFKSRNPSDLLNELNSKSKGLAKWQYGVHLDRLQQYIANNDYESARYYVDGVGEQLPNTSLDAYKSVSQLTSQIDTFERLYRQAENRLGAMSGRTWEFISKYAESDPLFFQLRAQQRLMLGAVARGPLQQKGMLSDTDIAMAEDVLGKPSMNLESALETLKLLRRTLQTNAQTNLELDSRNGFAIREVRDYVEHSVGYAPNDPAPLDPFSESAIDSFLQE